MKLVKINRTVAYVYLVFFLLLSIRLLLFNRGIYGIPDLLIYLITFIMATFNAVVIVFFGNDNKNLIFKTVIAVISVLIIILVLLSIYIFIGPEAKPHWESGDWKW